MLFKEKCWFLYGIKIRNITIGYLKYSALGDSVSVEFDWKKCFSKYLLGWFHTHSTYSSLYPSFEDIRTSRSWVRTLERPLVCGIMYEHKTISKMQHSSYIFKRLYPDKGTYCKYPSEIYCEPISSWLLYKKIYVSYE